MTRATGTPAPDFTLDDLEGRAWTLGTLLEAGPVVVFFFKCDCAATDIAAPFVERLWRGYDGHVSAEGTRLQVIGVSQEDRNASVTLREQHGLGFPILLDRDLAVSRSLDLEATPTMLLLRGAERLRADASSVPESARFAVIDVVEGWSKAAYEMVSEEVAARVGALPVDLFEGMKSVPEHKPG